MSTQIRPSWYNHNCQRKDQEKNQRKEQKNDRKTGKKLEAINEQVRDFA